MLLLQSPLKSVISDMLSEITKLPELLIGHWSEFFEHIFLGPLEWRGILWQFYDK